MPSDHIPDAKKMVELSRALTCAVRRECAD